MSEREIRLAALADQLEAAQAALGEAGKAVLAAQAALDQARAEYRAAERPTEVPPMGVRFTVPAMVLFTLRSRQRELREAQGRAARLDQAYAAALAAWEAAH